MTVVSAAQLDEVAPGNIAAAIKQLPQFRGNVDATQNNGIGTDADTNSPRHYIDDSAQWLDFTTNNDDTLTIAELSTGKIAASSPIWQSPSFGLDHSGSQLHSGLDEYNNHGTILGVSYASA